MLSAYKTEQDAMCILIMFLAISSKEEQLHATYMSGCQPKCLHCNRSLHDGDCPHRTVVCLLCRKTVKDHPAPADQDSEQPEGAVYGPTHSKH